MSGRVVIGAVVLLIVIAVLAIFLVIGNAEGGDSNTGSLGSPRTAVVARP